MRKVIFVLLVVSIFSCTEEETPIVIDGGQYALEKNNDIEVKYYSGEIPSEIIHRLNNPDEFQININNANALMFQAIWNNSDNSIVQLFELDWLSFTYVETKFLLDLGGNVINRSISSGDLVLMETILL